MSVITEVGKVAKDTLGISQYQLESERARKGQRTRGDQIVNGVLSGIVQVASPLNVQIVEAEVDGSANGRHKLARDVASMLLDIGSLTFVGMIATSNPPEAIPVAVGGKLIYNAAASAIPRAIGSAKTRFRPQRTA